MARPASGSDPMSPAGFSTRHQSKAYRNYVLFVLFLINAVLIIDHQIMSILMEPIKRDLKLSDSELGLLSGAGFAIFHAIAGLPIARLADRRSRVNIISVCLILWSGLTALSGFAQTFFHLLFARVGVGIGEAGGTPPSHALITDYFPMGRRAAAIGIHAAGVPVGLLIGLVVGGWVAENMGWRAAFFMVGVPGVLLGLLLKFTVKEPPRGMSDGSPLVAAEGNVFDCLKRLLKCRTFRLILIAGMCQTTSSFGTAQWLPSYFIRTLGLTPSEAGLLLGLIIGIAGAAGSFAGGFLADHLQKRDMRWYLWLPVLLASVTLPLRVVILLLDEIYVIGTLMFISIFLSAAIAGPEITAFQSVTRPSDRSMASAVILSGQTLVGMSLGPMAVGIMSDLFANAAGINSLRYALLALSPMLLASLLLHLAASRHIRQDIATANRSS